MPKRKRKLKRISPEPIGRTRERIDVGLWEITSKRIKDAWDKLWYKTEGELNMRFKNITSNSRNEYSWS